MAAGGEGSNGGSDDKSCGGAGEVGRNHAGEDPCEGIEEKYDATLKHMSYSRTGCIITIQREESHDDLLLYDHTNYGREGWVVVVK